MSDLPRLRVHPTLGVAMRWPGQEHWWVMLENEVPWRVSDEFVLGEAWRELWVMEQYSGKGLITAEQAEAAAKAIMGGTGWPSSEERGEPL